MQVLVYFYCNEHKEYSSMNPRDVEYAYADEGARSREKLARIMMRDTWVHLQEGYTTAAFEKAMSEGNIREANDMLRDANIFSWEVKE